MARSPLDYVAAVMSDLVTREPTTRSKQAGCARWRQRSPRNPSRSLGRMADGRDRTGPGSVRPAHRHEPWPGRRGGATMRPYLHGGTEPQASANRGFRLPGWTRRRGPGERRTTVSRHELGAISSSCEGRPSSPSALARAAWARRVTLPALPSSRAPLWMRLVAALPSSTRTSPIPMRGANSISRPGPRRCAT